MAERLTERDGEHDEGSKAYVVGKRVNLARLTKEIDDAASSEVPLVAEGDPQEEDLIIWTMVHVDEQTVLDVIDAHDPDAEPESPAISPSNHEDLLADLASKEDLTDDEVRLAVQTLLIPYRRH